MKERKETKKEPDEIDEVSEFEKFEEFARRLMAVPKEEIDEAEKKTKIAPKKKDEQNE